MDVTAKPAKRNPKTLLWTLVFFVVTLFISMAMEEMTQLPQTVRIPVVLLPVGLFAFFIYRARKVVIEGEDELEQRIQLEALSIAFPLTFLLITLLGQLERVIHLNPEDWDYSHIWPFIFMFYLVGLIVARRRYQ